MGELYLIHPEAESVFRVGASYHGGARSQEKLMVQVSFVCHAAELFPFHKPFEWSDARRIKKEAMPGAFFPGIRQGRFGALGEWQGFTTGDASTVENIDQGAPWVLCLVVAVAPFNVRFKRAGADVFGAAERAGEGGCFHFPPPSSR